MPEIEGELEALLVECEEGGEGKEGGSEIGEKIS